VISLSEKAAKIGHEAKIIDKVMDLLRKLEIRKDQFRGGRGGISLAHNAVVDAIGKWWEEDRSIYLETYGERIDFVGREMAHGKILLAVEVDRGHRAQRSWDKLADTCAENKVWIYISDSKSAPQRFDEAKGNIHRFLRLRGEDLSTFGKFAVAMKTPTEFKAEFIN
jgi:hypothetical protein